jgi:uncharacterized protein
MELLQLIEQLSGPSAYPYPVESIEVVQTHISVVFLAGSFVYKIKKPLHLEFLDFSTLEKRKHFCDEELRLNRRLAPDVYLGVVPIVATPEGLRFEAEGDAVEWAVRMQRLPQETTLQQHLYRNQISPELLATIARKLVSFHASAARSEHIAPFARFELVANNARENLVQAETEIGKTISQPVFDRLRALLEQALADIRSQIEDRVRHNIPCDTHGDLRLDHI